MVETFLHFNENNFKKWLYFQQYHSFNLIRIWKDKQI